MRKIILLSFLLAIGYSGFSQQSFNMTLLANVEVGESGNDIWGYVDGNGIEYAVMGSRTATRIFSLEDPENPRERIVISGASSTWRDMKHFGDHVYVTTDQGSDGLLIVNMSQAPEMITFKFWQPELTVSGQTEVLRTCHNLYVDENGYCYLSGCNNSNGGVMIFDLNNDPENPEYLGAADLTYSHDVYVKGDLMYTSEINNGRFGIYDISDRTNPVLTATENTTSFFTHNAWLSDDGNYLFTTDERPNAFVDAYDISDRNEIKRLDAFQPAETAGNGVIPHNTHYYNGFLVTSWYTDGVIITDASRPDNLIQVGHYDTFLGPHGGFNGCWGAYPYLPSGLILASDIQTGLYVFRADYKRACYLEGKVTDFNTGSAINGVSVEIGSEEFNAGATDASGSYKTGQATAGTFMVTFTHPNYEPVVADAVLINGEVTILDVQMGAGQKMISGSAIKASDGEGIDGAKVVFVNEETGFETEIAANDEGNFSAWLLEGSYQVLGGAWGYLHVSEEGFEVKDGASITLELDKGYQDDFFADLDWTVESDATTGFWERAVPNGISFQGNFLTPGEDVESDLGSKAYVTGNGDGVGADDIDDGSTALISPVMDFTQYEKVNISYSYWFVNAGGNGPPNDNLTIILRNADQVVTLETITDLSNEWADSEIEVTPEMISFTDEMQIIFYSEDSDPGHLVESAIDKFLVTGSLISDYEEILDEDITLSAYPNPFSSEITIKVAAEYVENSVLEISNILGEKLLVMPVTQTENVVSADILDVAGLYFVQLKNGDKVSPTVKLIKQ